MFAKFTYVNVLLWTASIAIYVWAYGSTALTGLDGFGDRSPTGLRCLLIGWVSLIERQLFWMANPLLFAALFAVTRVKTVSGAKAAVLLSGLAVVLGRLCASRRSGASRRTPYANPSFWLRSPGLPARGVGISITPAWAKRTGADIMRAIRPTSRSEPAARAAGTHRSPGGESSA